MLDAFNVVLFPRIREREPNRRHRRGGSHEARMDGRKGGAGHAAASPTGRIADGKTDVACHRGLGGGDSPRQRPRAVMALA